MSTFWQAGGFSMWIVTLFGLLSLGHAGWFAWKADARRLAIIRALTWATVFAVLTGMLSNFTAVMWNVNRHPELTAESPIHMVVMQGLGEAVTPGVMGFTLLSLTWMFVALGTRRLNDRD